MFADDTRLFKSIANEEDREQLQEDLDRLVGWSKHGSYVSMQESAKLCTSAEITPNTAIPWNQHMGSKLPQKRPFQRKT